MGFVYGEGVYETLPHLQPGAVSLRPHVRRLRQSAERILLDVPFDDATLLGVDRPDVAAGGRARGKRYIRVSWLTRGDRRIELRPEVHAEADDRDHREAVSTRRRAAFHDDGIRISLCRDAAQPPEVGEPGIKVEQPAEQRARDAGRVSRGAEEALMCNYRGELTECSQANFFMVRGGACCTPKSAAGLLEGVTRAFIFELGRELGIDVREETPAPKDLETADEMFHHLHHARAEPRRQGRRPRRRIGKPGRDHPQR
jgi:branched-chain amino acid aminotransferase